MSKGNKWFEFSQEDRMMAELALKEGLYNQACFHSQQGAEKTMKGFLLERRNEYPKSHSLLELFELCKEVDGNFEAYFEDCEYLDRFYTPTRYPDAAVGTLPEGAPGKTDAKKAIGSLDRIMKFVMKEAKIK